MACKNWRVWCTAPDGPKDSWCEECQVDVHLPKSFGNRLSYGAGRCPQCGRRHAEDTTLLESGGSKAFVEVLMANLVRVGFDQNCMVGALVPRGSSPKVLIACSGFGVRPRFDEAAKGMGNAIVCPDVGKQSVRTRGGATVSVKMIDQCKVDNEPLSCAAPKMIDYANRHYFALPYSITEVMFNPSTHKRFFEKRKGFTVHGHSIESCKTCEKIVPLLLCGESGDRNLPSSSATVSS